MARRRGPPIRLTRPWRPGTASVVLLARNFPWHVSLDLITLDFAKPPRISRMERRFAAILAADVVGYGWLMGLGEAGTLAVQRGAPTRNGGQQSSPGPHRQARRRGIKIELVEAVEG